MGYSEEKDNFLTTLRICKEGINNLSNNLDIEDDASGVARAVKAYNYIDNLLIALDAELVPYQSGKY